MPAPSRTLAAILAVVLPVLVFGGGMLWLGAPRERPLSELAVRFDRRLAAAKGVEVVVVGNSKARTDIDPATVAAALAVRPQQVVALDIGASTAPAWYAALENRVYANGHEPPLVLVYGPLAMMLDTEVYGAVQRMRLEEQLGAVEPVLGPKVLGRTGGATFGDRAREQRTELHQHLLDRLKGVSVLAFGPRAASGDPTPGDPTPGDAAGPVDAAIDRADPALERLFGVEGQIETRQRVIPVAEATGPLIASKGGTAESSLLADFVALAHAHGSRIVFVRAPLAPSERATDALPAQDVRGVVDLLNAQGAGWLDLSAIALPDGAFRDALHLNKRGRDALSAALVTGLTGIGAIGGDAIVPATPPLAVGAPERVGAGAPLPALAPERSDSACGWVAKTPSLRFLGGPQLAAAGLGGLSPIRVLQDGVPLQGPAGRDAFADTCGGAWAHFGREVRFSPTDRVDAPHTYTLALAPDLPLRTDRGDTAWWVYPGTAVRWALPEGGDDLRIDAWIQVLGPGGGAVVVTGLAPTDRSVAITGEGPQRVRLALDAPPGAAVEIRADATPAEAWVVVEALSITRGSGAPLWLAGQAPAAVRLLEGRVTYAADPAPLPATGPVPGEGNLRVLTVPGTATLDDATLTARLGVPDCSPVVAIADGKPLTAAHTAPAQVDRFGGGRYAHVGDTLLVGEPNDLAPPAAGHVWGAGLDPRRRCEGGRWLYPGDTATIVGPGPALRGLRRGADQLTLVATAIGDGAAPLHVLLTAGDRVVLDEDVAPDRLADPLTWALDPPLPARAPTVTLTLSTRADSPYVLVANAALTEPELPVAAGSDP